LVTPRSRGPSNVSQMQIAILGPAETQAEIEQNIKTHASGPTAESFGVSPSDFEANIPTCSHSVKLL
jgi:hypothetical protein